MTRRPHVDVLYTDDCPHYGSVVDLVQLLLAELAMDAHLNVVRVADRQQATALRFLGSPTVRVEGRDFEPAADARTDYGLGCRVYQGDEQPSFVPHPRWIRWALEAAYARVAER